MPHLYRLLLPALMSAALCTPVLAQGKPPPEPAQPAPGQEVVFTSPADLEQALKTLQQRAKVNLIVDWTDLTDDAIERDKPITLHLRDVPLDVVLREVLRQAGGETQLGYRVGDGLVRVATQDALRSDVVLLDHIQFKDTPLPKIIDFLRSADPSFKVVLAGEAGASPDDLIVSELELRKVTASQVLEALKMAYPRINVSFTGDEPPVWTVRVEPDRSAGEPVTSVFRLREAINQVQQDMELSDRDKARAAVLQLIEQAARMNTSHGEAPPVLQLHEATDTLLFRGTVDQLKTVAKALEALVPSPASMFGQPSTETKKTPRPPAVEK
jgi:hypothetical protein